MRKLLGFLGIALTVGSLAGFIPTSVMLALGGLELPLAHAVALLGTLFGGAAGGMVMAIAGFSGGDRMAFEREQKILQLAAASSGKLTVAEVAAGAQLGVAESKAALEQMCVHGVAEVQIDDKGEIIYEFAGLKRAAEQARAALPAAEKPKPATAARAEPEVIEAEIISAPNAPARVASEAVVPTGGAEAPYGISPYSGRPYSPRRKTVAGLLQIVPAMMGFAGVGRIYTGHFFRGLGMMALGWLGGIGILWSLLDGLFVLTTEKGADSEGRPLRPDQPKLPPHRPS